jgi:hypothetical protein
MDISTKIEWLKEQGIKYRQDTIGLEVFEEACFGSENGEWIDASEWSSSELFAWLGHDLFT